MELTLAAQMDKMTMLYNHETTMQIIMDTLGKYPAKKHALFMFDVDNFKIINDTKGHQAGDEFLIKIAGIIKKSFRQNDVVGRIGGDEFLALMCDVSDIAIIKKKAEDILVKVYDLCKKCEYTRTSVSIGISIYPDNGTNLQELYHNADGAMYRAKNNGKNQFFIIENN